MIITILTLAFICSIFFYWSVFKLFNRWGFFNKEASLEKTNKEINKDKDRGNLTKQEYNKIVLQHCFKNLDEQYFLFPLFMIITFFLGLPFTLFVVFVVAHYSKKFDISL